MGILTNQTPLFGLPNFFFQYTIFYKDFTRSQFNNIVIIVIN